MQASECKAHSFPQFYQPPVLVSRVHPPHPIQAPRREKGQGNRSKDQAQEKNVTAKHNKRCQTPGGLKDGACLHQKVCLKGRKPAAQRR